MILAAENLNSKFSLLSSNFSKAAFGKMPRAGIGESQRMAKCHEPNLGILRVIFDEMPYSPQNPEMLYMISLKRLYLS